MRLGFELRPRNLARCGASGLAFLVVCAANAHPEDTKPKLVPDLAGDTLRHVIQGLDREFAGLPGRMNVPGMAVAIVKDGRVLLLKGYGLANVKEKRPVTPDTLFEIASCSKAFNSALVLFGVDQGKLSLRDSPRKYLPYFRLRDPDADGRITIADLMCHRSGLPRTDDAWITGRITSEEAIGMLAESEPTYLIGSVGQYSNVLVQASGSAVAAVYGKPWAEALQEQVLGPLQMTRTTAKPYNTIDPKAIATGYRIGRDGRIATEMLADEKAIVAAGGVKSCAGDLANWVQFHLNGGVFEGRRLISAEVLGQAYRRWFEYGEGSFAGLGWFTDVSRPLPVIWHDGYLPGFQALVTLVPERRLGFAILTNNSGAGLNLTAGDLILDRMIGKRDTAGPLAAANACGLFFDPAGRHIVRVLRIGQTLFARLDDGGNVRLARRSRDRWSGFDSRDGEVSLTYERSPFDARPDSVAVKWRGLDLSLTRSPKYRADISADELMRRSVIAIGAKPGRPESQTLSARYTERYRSQALDANGLCYFGPNDQVGWFERDYALGRPLSWSQSGIADGVAKSSSDFYRLDDASGDDILNNWLEPLPIQQTDWRNRFHRVSLVGKTTFLGEPVYLVLKTPKRGASTLDYVSAVTWLIRRREFGGWPVVEELDDYHTVDGRVVPTHIIGTDSQSRKYDIRLTELHFQDRAPHWAFHPSPWPGLGE
jgi:CubicO group peptidase (beta-lactamase class C family)